MFKIESYVTPILLSYVDKYVKDFKPADAQVSLWGGGVALHNLVLKADVLQQEVSLPFTLVSGRIHELLIQVPWTKIMSEPIVVTIDTIECVLSLRPHRTSVDESSAPDTPTRKSQVVEAPPGYMQALVRRIVSNISLRVHHLIVKFVHDDIVLSLNVKHVAIDSAGENWTPYFSDIDPACPVVRRLVRLDDLTLCLDRTDADGKIRFYQEPLLYRCRLELRVQTRLVSATTRRAASLSLQLRSGKLAWGVTDEQLLLLLRLATEQPTGAARRRSSGTPSPKVDSATQSMMYTSQNTAEPNQNQSWSEWAWSWMPAWSDRQPGVEESPPPPAPLPMHFALYLDEIGLIFKIMETEGSNRKRPRGILEMKASRFAAKCVVCVPTTLRFRCGLRRLELSSNGKCVCGHMEYNSVHDLPTVYLRKAELSEQGEEHWQWPDDQLDADLDVARIVTEAFDDSEADPSPQTEEPTEPKEAKETKEEPTATSTTSAPAPAPAPPETPEPAPTTPEPPPKPGDDFWSKMSPLLSVEYNHDRTPPKAYISPYDNPPKEFEFSDWVEDFNLKVQVQPMEIMISMGLLHRLESLRNVIKEVPRAPEQEPTLRTLTVEECEALLDNLPQRHAAIEIAGARLRIMPWNHVKDRVTPKPPCVLEVELMKASVLVTMPLYADRVCSAACQMPEMSGPLWQGARVHVSASCSLAVGISASGAPARKCGRAEFRILTHRVAKPAYFTRRSAVLTSLTVKLYEANICGSMARLQAAYEVASSLLNERISLYFKHTSLSKDALNDEELVALDMTIEDLSFRAYLARNIFAYICTLRAIKATALHKPKDGELKQAWLCSAPDNPTTTPFLRIALQWCDEPMPDTLDYLGVWTEPCVACVDPLLIVWLSYSPALRPMSEMQSQLLKNASSQYYRHHTLSSSNPRGLGRSSGSGTHVHMRPRSQDSSEPSEKPTVEKQVQTVENWWSGEHLLQVYNRLRQLLLNVEIGLVDVYTCSDSASAVDCETVRGAMERHANKGLRVFALSLGKIMLNSSSSKKELWFVIRHDGPTFLLKAEHQQRAEEDSFPWKMRVTEMSCYTLELSKMRESSGTSRKSQLKANPTVLPKTVLESVTTTVTISVVTKTATRKTKYKKPPEKKHHDVPTEDEMKMKYFTSGIDFKPTSLKEFVRGPLRRKKKDSIPQEAKPETKSDPEDDEYRQAAGPVVSLGFNVHADTPPIMIRLDHDQVGTVADAIHCMKHVQMFLRRGPLVLPKYAFTSFGSSHRSLVRSVSQTEEQRNHSEDTVSESKSELISIFEPKANTPNELPPLKTFFWFQWVISRVTVVVATRDVKLTFEIDDIISTIDLQAHYNQLKVKIASAAIKHYELSNTEWAPGVLGGRILEAREPAHAQEDNHFMAVTITQALISNLPASWKEELHPKLLESKNISDSMWEIYVTLAPLEAVLEQQVLLNIVSVMDEMAPQTACPLDVDTPHTAFNWQWPFCYVTAGGLRLLLTSEMDDENVDDTFIITFGKLSVNPHPENPICRRAVNAGIESAWSCGANGALEGRQYEITARAVSIKSSCFSQLVNEEESEHEVYRGMVTENPALKWTQQSSHPSLAPILHEVDLGCVLAPAMYVNDALAAGPAIEFNLVSDCSIEVSIAQIGLATRMIDETSYCLHTVDKIPESSRESSCPYAQYMASDTVVSELSISLEDIPKNLSEIRNPMEAPRTPSELYRSANEFQYHEAGPSTADSGIDTATSRSTLKYKGSDDGGLKKTVSLAFYENTGRSSDYLEVFVTMGTIDFALYCADDDSPRVVSLRPPKLDVSSRAAAHDDTRANSQDAGVAKAPASVADVTAKASLIDDEAKSAATGSHESSRLKDDMKTRRASHPLKHAESKKSLTETVRNVDVGKTKLERPVLISQTTKNEGLISLIHVTVHQPNLYYYRRKLQKILQISLYNLWIGLGASQNAIGMWHASLLSTARGVPDPVTDISPALATMKLTTAPAGGSAIRGSLCLDVERPLLLEVCADKLTRLKTIRELLNETIEENLEAEYRAVRKPPFLYNLRQFLVKNSIERVTIQTGQVGVCGPEGTFGWDASSLQLGTAPRPERLVGRALLTALLGAMGRAHDRRHPLLLPAALGMDLEATWDPWHKTDSGAMAKRPSVRICLDIDRISLDVRPADLASFMRLRDLIVELRKAHKDDESSADSTLTSTESKAEVAEEPPPEEEDHVDEDHYYKDDLRSGAFKIVTTGTLPMAYQVLLQGDSVSWRYPYSRAITRLIAYPMPGLNEETDCVLEWFSTALSRWEAHTYFKFPVGEPLDLNLYNGPLDAVFALMWRFRVCVDKDKPPTPFEFNITKYMPVNDPLVVFDIQPEPDIPRPTTLTGQQMAGAARIDSCSVPRAYARTRLTARVASAAINVHCAPPAAPSQATSFDGYYVSRPMMRSHPMLALLTADTLLHFQTDSSIGQAGQFETWLEGDILACSTGAMLPLVERTRIKGAASLPVKGPSRFRLAGAALRASVHASRLRTLMALAKDWSDVTASVPGRGLTRLSHTDTENIKSRSETAASTVEELEGRVSLWVHNSCATALRVGQQGSDDVTPLGPNVSLAYRWRNSSAPKQLRFALAGPSANWHWSNSIPFLPGSSRVRLQDADATAEEGAGGAPSAGVFLYVDVREPGAKYAMRLSGRLQLANLLRQDLLYKVRTKCPTTGQWRIVIGSSELKAETLGLSVVCGSEWDMVLKVKFMSSDTGWSGDIPLKECPKENVPWLVKVPREGDPPYQAVWCRVTRARSDGRVLAAVWPLYTIHSRLPLDTDVLIHTDNSQSNPEPAEEGPVLTQAASGRGVSTHLLTAGTTRARHSLHFKYRHGLDSPVTAESVPLHYGVTDVSVFDKCAPVDRIEDVVDCVQTWLDQYGQNVESQWPYSIVSKHYWGEWKPALSQPKCDVTIRYQAVRAGGGCALQLQLSPAALLCNATPLALTLRAHDAAPLCRVGAGVALAPPTSLLTKPFFMSMELGRETFVSGQLSVLATEPGRYGAPPPGHVAVDRPADFAIHCNHKVALLTLYYEIIEGINVLGVSSTYVLINKLHDDVLVSAVAVPDLEEATEAELMTKNYKFVPPTKKTDAHGTMVCRFAMAGRWRGGDPSELRAYVCVALPDGERAGPAVPVRLAAAPPRRAVSLLDERRHSVPIVVAQLKHEGRWVVTIAKDPCPQFVVHNRTSKCLAIGQPTDPDPSQITVQAVRECQGVAWWCRVEAGSVGHYSTPEYSARHPLPAAPAPPPPVTLTVAVHPEEGEPVWSAPIAIADGEQLVQLSGSHTFKVRVRTHPHSSLVELKDVDERDISASDIRKRLIGTSKAEEVRTGSSPNEPSINLKQIYEQPKFVRPDGTEELATQEVSEEVPCVAGHVDSLASFEMLARGGDASAENYNDSVAASSLAENERFRCMFSSVSLQVAKNRDVNPLLAAHLDRVTVLVLQDNKKLRTAISVADLQIDNLQYDSGQFDFAVVASTRNEAPLSSPLPSIWNIFNETRAFATRQDTARALIYMCHDTWSVGGYKYTELTELDIRLGPLALYVEDAYITALAELARIAAPPLQRVPRRLAEAETSVLERPLRLRLLHLQPLQLTLTLHTAARMYIALDQSPLSLSAFKLRDMMTSTQRLSHALTVHYLSAAVLGAGWMVGGLELLGAPGALAARVGGASGGVKGVASAAAAGLLRSVSAWAGSVARNLDLLAGDEEHARRAAAARRRPPPSLLAGLMTGITNLAINMLGAVGGLAHHPVVSVAAGEASGAAALRRGLLGALTKPLSATADLLAYAGSGLLAQTGWDPAPTPRPLWRPSEASAAGWRRDRVRWTFRLNELSAWGGAGVLLEQRVLQLLLTHRYLVIAEADTERIVEMIDFKNCSLGPYQGHTIELMVTQRKPAKALERLQIEDEDEYQISAAAMARVARYTGSDTAGGSEARVLALLPSPGQSVSLYAQLHAAILHNSTSHFPLL